MIEELRKLEELGYVRGAQHKELPLIVWNYSPVVQFENLWSEYPLLLQCRGLITDLNGNIYGRGFSKFFNYEQHQVSELPFGQKIEVTKKMDGSLLIVFRYEDQVVYSTRGAFFSEQAIAAGKLFKEIYNEDWIENGKTFLFEYIAPDNRIVVSYDKADLVHLAVIDNLSGRDLPRDSRYNCVETFEVDGGLFGEELYDKLKSLNTSNEEGFVIRAISDGNNPDWRCKIKFQDYCHLHKIVTGISNKHVWEMLKDNLPFEDILEITPDEFNDWLKATRDNLIAQYNMYEAKAKEVYNAVKEIEGRKDQAIALTSKYKDVSSIVFKMLDGSAYSELIWKMIKPDKHIQPFSNKGEE